jgi:hypothetical protein
VTLSWYALLLLLLPLQQPFWLMSVYPLLTLVLSAAITHHLQPARSWPVRVTAAAVVVLASVWLGFGVARVYPTFGFYGYETVGDRWLGESSRGYRSLVVVTNDGTTEALAWLREYASGTRVLSYLDDVFLINVMGQVRPFPFELTHASGQTPQRLAHTLDHADVLVVRAIDDLQVQSPVVTPGFSERFAPVPAYEVVRGRGVYQMPVIQIYQRKPAG